MTSSQDVFRRPWKVISCKEKLAIVRQFESGSTRREIGEIFMCSQATISRILVSKDTILKEAKNCTDDEQENLVARKKGYKELYKALTHWVKNMKQNNSEITAHMARKKAEELSRNMNQVLSPSRAWLYKWKESENVTFAKNPTETRLIITNTLGKPVESKMDSENINKESSKFPELNDKKIRLKSIRKNCNKLLSRKKCIKKLSTVDESSLICGSKKEKTFLNLLQKLEILKRLKNGERRTDLTTEYNLSQSTMLKIVNDEEKIFKKAAEGQNLQMKRIKAGIFCDGEAELNDWVLQRMAKGENLTKTQIIKRAKEIAERLNIDFKASRGWLEKWKARMNMDFDENKTLRKKAPQYLTNDGDLKKGIEEEHSDKSSDHIECQKIKQEMEDCNDTDSSHERLNCEIKRECLTPQQPDSQTVENNYLVDQCGKELQENKENPKNYIKKEADDDIKPLTTFSLCLE